MPDGESGRFNLLFKVRPELRAFRQESYAESSFIVLVDMTELANDYLVAAFIGCNL